MVPLNSKRSVPIFSHGRFGSMEGIIGSQRYCKINSDCTPHNSVSSCLSVVISLATTLIQRHIVCILQFPGVHGECGTEYHAVGPQGLQVYYLVTITDYAETTHYVHPSNV